MQSGPQRVCLQKEATIIELDSVIVTSIVTEDCFILYNMNNYSVASKISLG